MTYSYAITAWAKLLHNDIMMTHLSICHVFFYLVLGSPLAWDLKVNDSDGRARGARTARILAHSN